LEKKEIGHMCRRVEGKCKGKVLQEEWKRRRVRGKAKKLRREKVQASAARREGTG
jgi:hypothetical protein